MGTQHIIELNGKRYDALTGKIVATYPHQTHTKPKTLPSPITPHNVDGFARRSSHPPRKVADTTWPHHQAEKSKTLMRSAVPKPKVHPSKAKTVKNHQAIDMTIESQHFGTPSDRLKRARHVVKSELIRHFNPEMDDEAASASSVSSDVRGARRSAAAIVPAASSISMHTAEPLASALAHATSHTQPKLKRQRLHRRVAHKLHLSPKIVSVGSVVIAILLLGGFFGYQNLPKLSMRLASARSGVHGTVPTYKPAGFSLARSVQYKPGQVTLLFKSNSDERNFQVSQTASSWDSESLRENFVAASNKPFQTIQDKGKTIYVYDSNNATWVDSGVWYKIEGKSELSSDQLMRLVNSF